MAQASGKKEYDKNAEIYILYDNLGDCNLSV